MRKFKNIFALLLIYYFTSFSQIQKINEYTDRTTDQIYNFNDKDISFFPINYPIGYVLDNNKKSNSVNTKIYGFWDLQSNGGAINYIEMNPINPDNIHVIMMVSTDSGSATTVSMSRRIMYNFSNDGGITWGNPITVPNIRAGYPSLILTKTPSLDYVATIAGHGSPGVGLPMQSSLYIDSSEGVKNFSSYLPPLQIPGNDDVLWPIIAQTTNGNIVLAGSFPSSSSLQGLSVITFKNDKTWSNWNRFETSSNHAGRIAVAAGENGKVAVIWRANTNPDSIVYRESLDNGITWGQKFLIERENGSTGPCWTGFDAIYIGEILFVTYTSSSYDAQGYKIANSVKIWNSNTRISTTVLDSIYFSQMMKTVLTGRLQTNHNFAFNFPTIGRNTNSSRIYIATDVFLQDITDIDGYNYSDILLTYSDDGGINWLKPINITNTITLDERYVSISTINPIISDDGNDSNWVYIVYQEDKIPGANYVTLNNEPEARPVSRASLKFTKINVDRFPEINIHLNLNEKWNMVSLPVNITGEVNSIFPSAASNAFTFDPQIGYISQSILSPGFGYWIKFNQSQTIDISGPILNSKVIQVKPGWNMIGSISNSVSINNIIQNPDGIIQSKFFEYNDGYIISDTLKPGKAYWVKINQVGTLNLISP